jgi:starch synthase
LTPQYIRTVYVKDPTISRIASLFTIHNLYFQGNFDHRFVSDLDFDDGKSEIPSFFDERLHKVNSMRRGIMYADIVNTVSEKYSKEILTPEYGERLEQLLQEVRTKLYGVLNGIDYDEFSPKTDKIVKHNFDKRDVFRVRPLNKAELQAEFNLPRDPNVCILATSFRLDEQKGLDLIAETIGHVLAEFPVQYIANGDGDGRYKSALMEIAERFPRQVGLNLHSNFTLPRHIFAGADMILLPSKFEPCGIVQMEAMRYGCVPVVREVGGLADTVGDGVNGYTFKNFDKIAFFGAIVRALENYFHHPEIWRRTVLSCMEADFSWENSAKRYIDLYKRAVELKCQRAEARTHPGVIEKEI